MRAYRKVKDHYEFRLDGGRLALLGVGAGLVLVLVFLLGVLVGKALWGGRRLPVTVPVPVAESGSQEVPAEPVPSEQPNRPQYTFYEELKKPDPPAAREPEPVTSKPETEPTPKPIREAITRQELPPRAESRPQEEPLTESASAPAVEPPVMSAKPQPVMQKSSAPVFTVQVGSFRDRVAASQLADQIEAHGVRAEVVEASVAGRTWYRVQVGRFETRSEAEGHYRRRLKPKGVQGFVTTR